MIFRQLPTFSIIGVSKSISCFWIIHLNHANTVRLLSTDRIGLLSFVIRRVICREQVYSWIRTSFYCRYSSTDDCKSFAVPERIVPSWLRLRMLQYPLKRFDIIFESTHSTGNRKWTMPDMLRRTFILDQRITRGVIIPWSKQFDCPSVKSA
jgi:hypothetical protein